MKRFALPLTAITLAAALLAVGCSGTDAATTTSAPTTTGAGGGLEVSMDSFAFSPAELTVPVGSTVTWTNHHAARHDVVAADGTFASPLLDTGESFSFTFTEPGEYSYVCTIHPAMQGTIVVTP